MQDITAILESENIPQAISHLECDGATWVISDILTRNSIPHSIAFGKLITGSAGFKPIVWLRNDKDERIEISSDSVSSVNYVVHVWIILDDGRYVDFRSKMWSSEAPEGVFPPLDQFHKVERIERPNHTISTIAKVLRR